MTKRELKESEEYKKCKAELSKVFEELLNKNSSDDIICVIENSLIKEAIS